MIKKDFAVSMGTIILSVLVFRGKLVMGWLKDTHVSSNLPDVDFYYTLPDNLFTQNFFKQEDDRSTRGWQQYLEGLENRCTAAYQMAQQAEREITERDSAKPKAGPRPSVHSYKEYKLKFLSRWAKFISESANNLTQSELAIELGFGNKPLSEEAVKLGFGKKTPQKETCHRSAARQLRMMMSSEIGTGGGYYRCSPDRFNNKKLGWVKIARENNWNRRGLMTPFWVLNRLMSPDEFEEWAKNVASMSFDDFHTLEKEKDLILAEINSSEEYEEWKKYVTGWPTSWYKLANKV